MDVRASPTRRIIWSCSDSVLKHWRRRLRDLLRYPITKEEIISLLQDVDDSLDHQLVGDIRPGIVQSLIAVVERDYKVEDYNPYFTEFSDA